MNFLVSSKSLAICLNKIPFSEGDFVTSIAANGKEIIFYSQQTSTSIMVEPMENDKLWPMREHRWDWVQNLMNSVSEQPVIITITPLNVNVTFQY